MLNVLFQVGGRQEGSRHVSGLLVEEIEGRQSFILKRFDFHDSLPDFKVQRRKAQSRMNTHVALQSTRGAMHFLGRGFGNVN